MTKFILSLIMSLVFVAIAEDESVDEFVPFDKFTPNKCVEIVDILKNRYKVESNDINIEYDENNKIKSEKFTIYIWPIDSTNNEAFINVIKFDNYITINYVFVYHTPKNMTSNIFFMTQSNVFEKLKSFEYMPNFDSQKNIIYFRKSIVFFNGLNSEELMRNYALFLAETIKYMKVFMEVNSLFYMNF